MKLISGIFSGIFAVAMISCGGVGDNESAETRTETKVIGVDTVGAETTYDVREKEITQVDTVGATTEYEVEKQVVQKTVEIDTLTDEIKREDRASMQEGDYEVVDEDVDTKTVTEEVEVDSK